MRGDRHHGLVAMTSLHERGVTLIELMIGLAIMAMLLLAALPFGARWAQGNRQLQARSLLWEGVSQARSIALRNPSMQRLGTPAAMLQMRGGQLEVVVPGEDAPLWAGTLRQGVRLRLSDAAGFADAEALRTSSQPLFDCVSFDAGGVRLPGANGCADNMPHLDRIAVGLASQEPLYVDRL